MDMLINLSRLPVPEVQMLQVPDKGITIRRAMAYERRKVCQWVADQFGAGWADECTVAFGRQPIGCYIAVQAKQVCGFCCLETTARNFIGPIGVAESIRGNGVGRMLLLTGLMEMRYNGYAYAVAGHVGAPVFFEKVASAVPIDSTDGGAYPEPLG